ncbi:hypothetical protein HMPREF9195_01235 [Treponema medium ATCC 700293]|uniref:Uncharacterized protein n=1 Tax=Treponema medium ATCC 700293 TaxID=1125700 RepID=A0AA87NRZ6_TREMD|nr:hypothetical protein HMPREF9195_01235 [Treponema medium ATCC 700293]
MLFVNQYIGKHYRETAKTDKLLTVYNGSE